MTALHLSMVLLARTVLLCAVVASIIFAGIFAVAATALHALIMCLCFIWTPYSTSQKWFTRISVSAIDLFRHAIGSALLHMYLCQSLWLPKPDSEDSSRPHASSDEGPLTASSRRTPDGMGASTSGDDGNWIRPPDYDSGAELDKSFRSPSPATSSVSSSSTEWGSYGDDEALPPIPSHWSSSSDDEQSESENDSEPIPEWVRHESIWCHDEFCSAPAVLPTVMSLCLTSSPSPRQSSWHSTFRPNWRMPTPCLPGRGRAPRLTDRRHLISLPPSVLNMVTWHVASRLLLTTSSASLCMVVMGVSLATMTLPVMTTRRAPVHVAPSTHA